MSNMTHESVRLRGYWPMAEWLALPENARPPHAVPVGDFGYFDPAVILSGAVKLAVDAALTKEGTTR